MKKRLRSLLTITLATGLLLAMTAGISSATITTIGSGSITKGVILSTETKIKSDAPGGMEIVYTFPDGTTRIDTAGQSVETDLIPDDAFGADNAGYTITAWQVESITNVAGPDASDAKDSLNLKASSKTPIHYTLEYYDSDRTTLLHKYENVTVENAEQFVSPSPKKDGYVFSHWVPVSSGGDFLPGISMSPLFLTTQGRPDNGYVIKFYAVWEKTSVSEGTGEPEPTPPLDDSPAAGDASPILPLLAIMTTTALAAAYTLRRWQA